MSGGAVPASVEVGPGGLTLHWPDGRFLLAAGALRAACRCAHCRAAARRGDALPARSDLQLTDAQPVGHYALQLSFSDGHDRGIFPWELLRGLCGEAQAEG
jgi:DUF971 family protein